MTITVRAVGHTHIFEEEEGLVMMGSIDYVNQLYVINWKTNYRVVKSAVYPLANIIAIETNYG